MTRIPQERQADVPSLPHFDLPDNYVLVDVREQHEWDRGHAPDAVHIPLGELERRLDELPRCQPLVITCRGGGRASRAVKFLRDQGYDARNLDGGMLEWYKQNRPMQHAGPGAPTVE